MRVSPLPPVLAPERVHDYLLSRVLAPQVVGVDGSRRSDALLFLLVPTTEHGPDSARPRGEAGEERDRWASGITRLLAEVVRAARIEVTRDSDGRYPLDLPAAAGSWLFDRTLLWSFLAGGWGRPQPSGGMHPPRRVDSSELLSIDRQQSAWTIRLSMSAEEGDVISWLVLEDRSSEREAISPDARPSRIVATAAQRIRDQVRAAGWANAVAVVRMQERSAIPGGSGMMRFDGEGFRSYWPLGSFRRLLNVLGTRAPATVSENDQRRSHADVWNTLQLRALLGLLEIELREWGLLRLVQTHARTDVEKRGRPAVRTAVELIRSEGVPRRSFVDSVYRDGGTYKSAATLFSWCSSTQRTQLRRSFGLRRWEQLAGHGLRRPGLAAGRGGGAPGNASGDTPGDATAGHAGDNLAYPWNAVTAAADVLVRRLAARVEQPGRRPPAATVEIVRRFYVEPRGRRLQAVWQRQIESGVLERLLEDVFLSQLRRDLPRLPREILVLAAIGEARTVRDRISAVFSRSGREMYLEDITAVERSIDRGEFSEWDRVLAARQRLWGIYNRVARARSRINSA